MGLRVVARTHLRIRGAGEGFGKGERGSDARVRSCSREM